MYVCMYVCMYVMFQFSVCRLCIHALVMFYMYVCMHVTMYVCIYHVWMYVNLHVCMYVFVMYICMYISMYVCMCLSRMYTCVCHVRMHQCMYKCMYVCIRMMAYPQMHACIFLRKNALKIKRLLRWTNVFNVQQRCMAFDKSLV